MTKDSFSICHRHKLVDLIKIKTLLCCRYITINILPDIKPYKTKFGFNIGCNTRSMILNVNIFFYFFLYVLLTNSIVFRNANYSFTSAPDVGPKYTEIEEARSSVRVCVHACVYIFYL